MIRPIAAVVVVVMSIPLLAAGQQAETAVDFWDAIYLEGSKAGSVHTILVEVENRGQKILRAPSTCNSASKRTIRSWNCVAKQARRKPRLAGWSAHS